MSTVSEDRSDTLSLRSHYLAGMGAASVTSSMWAEVCAQEQETASVDGLSLTDPIDAREERQGLDWHEVEGEMVLDIAPLGGRLLLLLSGAVDHAVAPCAADHVMVTAWYQ
ncbi:hypothetical protein QJQ45_025916 [Haematococcus lacustris]|nr:hypothetical protein QJQ45_025916 [Haematococcus lacustris]